MPSSVKRALVSVSDKTGVSDFAKGLHSMGVEILSTGGTARALSDAGVPVILVDDVTGFPEMLDGRVKTLHPVIHGGILARRDIPEHMETLARHSITPIDMVVVNLYPFEATIGKPGVSLEDAIENIDIGGPTLVRSAAKNYQSVAVVTNPARYPGILSELQDSGKLCEDTRKRLALEAFTHTAGYDALISRWLREKLTPKDMFPDELVMRYVKGSAPRYGENPHQEAAFYLDPLNKGVNAVNVEQLNGIALSYNNRLDLEAALNIVSEFKEPTAAVIKHCNPSGVACADSPAEAFRTAFDADPMSAYGCVVAFNRPVDEPTAQELRKHFIEAIIAPDFDKDALAIHRKKKKLRILKTSAPVGPTSGKMKYTFVAGGLLLQTMDFPELRKEELKVVTKKAPTEEHYRAFQFGYKIIRHVRSNSILLVKGTRTVGVGAGQMSRVDASHIAGMKAGEDAKGSVMASDAFFPFRDGIEEVAKVGAEAILQPGGSIRDAEVIDAADELGLAMVFSGIRCFRH